MAIPPQLNSGKFPNSSTIFNHTVRFRECLESINTSQYGKVVAYLNKFENFCAQGRITSSFNFKKIGSVAGCYILCQVYLGHDFRAFAMFLDNNLNAYWVYLWKKSAQIDEEDIKRGKSLAAVCWEKLQKGELP